MSNPHDYYVYQFNFVDDYSQESLDSYGYGWSDDEERPSFKIPKVRDVVTIKDKKYIVVRVMCEKFDEITDITDHGSSWDYRRVITVYCLKNTWGNTWG